jgi:hypothetical protein
MRPLPRASGRALLAAMRSILALAALVQVAAQLFETRLAARPSVWR